MAFPTLILQASTVRGSSSNFQVYLFSSALLIHSWTAELVHHELDFLQDFVHYLAPQPSVCRRPWSLTGFLVSVSAQTLCLIVLKMSGHPGSAVDGHLSTGPQVAVRKD